MLKSTVTVTTTSYTTVDGQVFTDEAKAKLHEINYLFKMELVSLLGNTLKNNTPVGIAAGMLYQHEKIKKILIKYAKKLPKEEKQAIREELAEAV